MRELSIRTRLSLGFYLFLFLVVFLGVFNIASLTDFNGVAEQIRNRWLPGTRFLGDLNNYTSDFRAAEGTLLLAANPDDIAASEREMDELDRVIVKAQFGYERIDHDAKETDLYRRFAQDWDVYRKIVNQVLAYMRSGNKEQAIILYKTVSKKAYDAASDTLGFLTEMDVMNDQEASDRAAAAYQHVRWLTVAAMLTAILMVVIGILYTKRSISTPMLDLAEAMHHLAANDMGVEIKGTQRQNEIGEMARALTVFRNNAAELILSRQGLAQQASMLEEKLQHERQLMDAQRNFISTASHEFRTPLAIIDGHAQRLLKLKESVPPDAIIERAGKIRSAVGQITGLIDNLINSVRLFEDNPQLYFHPTELDLVPLLNEVCDQHQDVLPEAQIVKHFGTEPLKISGDPRMLAQMFSNLLSNAIKYSPSGGTIDVSAAKDAQGISVSVRDQGVGIPQKDLQGIFERYTRGSNVTHISGTGIGLYLAKMIAELHGARITAQSTEGKGSVFTLYFPTA